MKSKKQFVNIIVVMLLFTASFTIAVTASNNTTTTNQKTSSTDWWPTYHHDIGRSGFSTSTAPIHNDTVWVNTTLGAGISSPAVIDNRVYIGSGNDLVCMDADTGIVLWRKQTGSFIDSSPAVVNGKVYIGSSDGKIYCFDTAGTPLWNQPTIGPIASAPAVAYGNVYVGSQDNAGHGKLYAFNATTGVASWPAYSTGPIISSPAVADGKIYIGDDNGALTCLNALTGGFVWSQYILPWSSPTVVSGKVYVGTYYSEVYCLNAATGATIWMFSSSSGGYGIGSTPAVAYGNVYVGESAGLVYCLDATGNGDGTTDLIWSYPSSVYDSAPAVADNKVYFCSENGELLCLNATGNPSQQTTSLIWGSPIDNYDGSPAIANSRLYIGGANNIFCFGYVPNNPPYVPSNPNPANGATNVNRNADLSWVGGDPDARSTLGNDLHNIVKYDVYFGTTSTPSIVSHNHSTPTYDPGTMSYDTTYYWKIVSWDDHGGRTPGPLWHFTVEVSSPPSVPSSPFPSNGAINIGVYPGLSIILSWAPSIDPDGDLVTYDVYFGNTSTPPKVASNLTPSEELGPYYMVPEDVMKKDTTYYWYIVAWDHAHSLPTAGPLWHFSTIPSIDWWIMLNHDSRQTASSASTAPNTKTLYFRYPLGASENAVQSSRAIINHRIYVGLQDLRQIICYDESTFNITNGQVNLIWKYIPTEQLTYLTTAPAVVDGKVFFTASTMNYDSIVYCLDATGNPSSQTTTLIWKYMIPYGYNIGSPLYADGKIYVSYPNGIICLDAQGNGNGTTNLIWHSPISGSFALYDGKVYVTADNTLYCLDENGNQTTHTTTVLWSYTGDIGLNTPVLVNDRVYLLSSNYNTYSHTLYCLDATPSDGIDEGLTDPIGAPYDVIWTTTFAAAYGTASNLAVTNGKIYLSADFHNVYCYNADNGSRIWSYYVSDYRYISTPAVADGKVYVATWYNYDGNIFCLDANGHPNNHTTTLLWKRNTTYGSGSIMDAPAIADGKLFVWGLCFRDNGAPLTPAAPTGPTSGRPQVSLTFTANTTDPNGDKVMYTFNWGDGSTSGWLGPFNSGETVSASHQWTVPGTYNITVKAKDALYYSSIETPYSAPLVLTIINHVPGTPTAPNGPVLGIVGKEYTYTTTALTDPDGDQVLYNFSWGDKQYTGWIDTPTATHKWTKDGVYKVKVGAKDLYSAGQWSATINVSILSLQIMSVSGGIGVTFKVNNSGKTPANDINWSVSINGGVILFPKSRVHAGVVSIPGGEQMTIVTPMIFGFGGILKPCTITIDLLGSVNTTVNAIVFGPFVKTR
jgi:outer membrane protein assembly factor BamB